jgi:hypothetical protein
MIFMDGINDLKMELFSIQLKVMDALHVGGSKWCEKKPE